MADGLPEAGRRDRPFLALVLERAPGVVLELRTARSWSVPPSSLVLGRTTRTWTTTDRLLALALTLFEQEQTPHGLPARVVFDDEAGSFIEVDDTLIDYAQAAKDRWVAEHKDHEPGVVLRAVLPATAPAVGRPAEPRGEHAVSEQTPEPGSGADRSLGR